MTGKNLTRKSHKHFFKVIELHPFIRICMKQGCNRKETYCYEENSIKTIKR
jgi:hypothetical protein